MPAPIPVEPLLPRLAAELAARRRLPESTYRLQFHAGFTFEDARRLVPYLHDLGVTDAYASPYLQARPGSQHGYDITNHQALNPEVGTREQYDAWVEALHARGMGQVYDLVPNHMGVAGNQNAWWNDVLENGPASPYARFFDIDWHPHRPDLQNKVLLPVLGDNYGQVLEAGQLQLRYEAGAFGIHYFDHRFPVAPRAYARVLAHRQAELEALLGKDSPELIEYQSILTAIAHLPPRTTRDPARLAERAREKEVVKRRLAALAESSPEARAWIDENVRLFNGRPGDPHSFDLLDDLLAGQAYRLAFWRVAADEINYRRFFDVNDLAALSQERPEVFEAAHAFVLGLLRGGKVTGLRVDHPDGLFDPKEYCERLQRYYALECLRALAQAEPGHDEAAWEAARGPLLEELGRRMAGARDDLWRRPLYVVVEKILGGGEALPADWPVHGTTGYDFLNAVNGLFVAAESAPAFSAIYNRWTDMDPLFRNYAYEKKLLILRAALASELHMLADQLDRLAQKHRRSRDFTRNSLRHALREIIACFPVYRSYVTAAGITPRDQALVEAAVARAKRRNPALSAHVFDFVRDMLLLRAPDGASPEDREEQLLFVGKFQQVTAPVMAKGLEDTCFYVYNRLLSLNEVGGDPDQFGVPVEEFHRRNRERQRSWPRSLLATATHDTKRGEDARARLDVLSELPRDWQRHLARWARYNRRHRAAWEDATAPSRNDEYLFYQTLIGAWPLGDPSPEEYAAFVGRIQGMMQKAIHEAKVHTSWVNPDPGYDEATRRFVARVLDRRNVKFLADFRDFQRKINHYGLFNALSQLVLKIGSPGVADVYQGTELWDFSLVDPDNRRPVDYDLRGCLLRDLRGGVARSPDRAAFARSLVEAREDGRVKLYTLAQGLHCRHDHPGLFAEGDYRPVAVAGTWSDNVVAFLRERDGRRALVAAPRLLTRLVPVGEPPLGAPVWQDTALTLPEGVPRCPWRNLFTDEVVEATPGRGGLTLAMADVLANFPVALLLAQD